MTTTHHDNDNGDQDDIMRGDDFSPHLSHPGTENPENPNEFHKNRCFLCFLVGAHQPKFAQKRKEKITCHMLQTRVIKNRMLQPPS